MRRKDKQIRYWRKLASDLELDRNRWRANAIATAVARDEALDRADLYERSMLETARHAEEVEARAEMLEDQMTDLDRRLAVTLQTNGH